MNAKKKLLLTSVLFCFLGCTDEPLTSDPTTSSLVPAKTEVSKKAPAKKYLPSPIPYIAQPGFLLIDGKSIEPKSFNKKMELLGAFSRVIEKEQLEEFVDRTIEDLINETLFRKIAKNQKIKNGAADAKLKEIKDATSDFEKHLQKIGQSEAELKAEIEDSMKTTAYVDSQIEITEPEMQALYKRNARNFKKPEQIRVSHIFFEVTVPADKKSALKRAKEVLKIVEAPGADFGEIAQKYSSGPTKQKKGDLGWFSRKQLLPRFSKAAFKLKTGEVSTPVWTERGYHIIKVFDKKPAEIRSFESAKPELRKTVLAKRRSDTIREIIRKAKKEGSVIIDRKKIVKNPDFKYAQGIRKTLPTEIKVPPKK